MKDRKKLLVAAGIALVIVIGGTFAYFNQTLSVENPFDTGKYDSVLKEDFSPSGGKNWEPGGEVNKDIEVKNTGDYDLIARVKFDEKWVNKDDGSITKENKGMDKTTGQVNANDGKTEGDDSVVIKNLLDDNWVYNAADGYWYYKSNLKAHSTTGKFLDSVKLLEDADMGKYYVTKYYTKAETEPEDTAIGSDPETQWVVYKDAVPEGSKHTMTKTSQDPDAPGYGNANYTLTITAETVQATKAAVKSAFGLETLGGCTWTLGE